MRAVIASGAAVPSNPSNEGGQRPHPVAGTAAGEMFSHTLAEVLSLFNFARAAKPMSQDCPGRGELLSTDAGICLVAAQANEQGCEAAAASPENVLQEEDLNTNEAGDVQDQGAAAKEAGVILAGNAVPPLPGEGKEQAGVPVQENSSSLFMASAAGDEEPAAGGGGIVSVFSGAGSGGAAAVALSGAGRSAGRASPEGAALIAGQGGRPLVLESGDPGQAGGVSAAIRGEASGDVAVNRGEDFPAGSAGSLRFNSAEAVEAVFSGGKGRVLAEAPEKGEAVSANNAANNDVYKTAGAGENARFAAGDTVAVKGAAKGAGVFLAGNAVPPLPEKGLTGPSLNAGSSLMNLEGITVTPGAALKVPGKEALGTEVGARVYAEKSGAAGSEGTGKKAESASGEPNAGTATSARQDPSQAWEAALHYGRNTRPEAAPHSVEPPGGEKGTALPELRDRLVREIRHFVNQKGEPQAQVQLKLEPEQLGHLTIKLYFHKGELSAHFYTGNEHVKEVLEGALHQLKLSLSQFDLNLSEAFVFVGSGSGDDAGRRLNEKSKHGRIPQMEIGRSMESTAPEAVKLPGGVSWQVDCLV